MTTHPATRHAFVVVPSIRDDGHGLPILASAETRDAAERLARTGERVAEVEYPVRPVLRRRPATVRG